MHCVLLRSGQDAAQNESSQLQELLKLYYWVEN